MNHVGLAGSCLTPVPPGPTRAMLQSVSVAFIRGTHLLRPSAGSIAAQRPGPSLEKRLSCFKSTTTPSAL